MESREGGKRKEGRVSYILDRPQALAVEKHPLLTTQEGSTHSKVTLQCAR